ncbi:MAG: response regulator [Verrucomicrobia bacterium]|jgi:two-component system KDP operon response regulator KdpE|nr:response regulator [Verrucomicrobiota bacterium]
MNKRNILIADDSLVVLKALELRLKAAGYDVATAVDASEAIEKAGQRHPDLVIMDVNFPPDISQGGVTWDGFQIIDWMRYTGSATGAPAIIITGDEVEQHRESALAAGAVAVFQKPIRINELIETIRECLEGTARAV